MSRSSIMTTGIVLILVGIQLNLVETYVMTPRFTKFWNERFTAPLYTTEDVIQDPSGRIAYRAPSTANPSGYSNYPFNAGRYQDYTSGTPALQASWSQLASSTKEVALGTQKQITPPSWLCWPIIFMGAVIFLHGATLGKQ